MQNSLFGSSQLYFNQFPYQFNGPRQKSKLPILNDEKLRKDHDIHPETRRKYEDFVSKLLDENKKLIELVDFQKQEIMNLHRNYQDMRYLINSEGQKSNESRNNLNSERILMNSNALENKYEVLLNDLTHKNQILVYEKEKLEENNKLYLTKINDLYEENKRINFLLEEIKDNGINSVKNQDEPKNKYVRIMDLITEIGEKEKNKEDFIFKILDLENKVNQLLMENDKLHKFIQEIRY